MEGVSLEVEEVTRGRNVVSESTDGGRVASHVVFLPLSEEGDEEVALELAVKNLGEEVKVGDKGSLEDNRDVGGVEKLHGVGSLVPSNTSGGQLELNAETLEVDDNEGHDNGSQQVGNVGRVLSPEGLLKGVKLVLLGEQEMEQSNDSAFKLSTLLSTDGHGGERFPKDNLADVSGDEKRDSTAKTVALLEQLVKQDHDDASNGKLGNNQDGVNGSKLGHFTVHAGEQVSDSLTNGDDDSEELLSGLEQLSVVLGAHVHFDDLGTSEELHDHG